MASSEADLDMSEEVRRGQEAALAAAALARCNLARNRTDIQPHQEERERRILDSFQCRVTEQTIRRYRCTTVPQSSILKAFYWATRAVFAWMEELGAAFEMPQDGHVVKVYTNVSDYVFDILDEDNGALVTKTLADSHKIFMGEDGRCLNLSFEDAMAAHFQAQHRNGELGNKELARKIEFWHGLATSVAGPNPSQLGRDEATCEPVAAELDTWRAAWAGYADADRWHATKYRRRQICRMLEDFAELLKIRGDAFNWSAENEEKWLDLEAERLLNVRSRKRKERDAVDQEESECHRLEFENAALASELEIARAASQVRFEKEVACQICLSSPRNAVLLPCRHSQFCGSCIQQRRKTRNRCPICRTGIKEVIICISSCH